MATEWREHLKLFVEKPELRPYFEDKKPLNPNDAHAQAILATADMRLDVADAILTYAAQRGAYNQITGWKNTFASAFRSSPVLCARLHELVPTLDSLLQLQIKPALSARTFGPNWKEQPGMRVERFSGQPACQNRIRGHLWGLATALRRGRSRLMQQKQSAADAAKSAEPTATTSSMDALFANLPDHVRLAQRRGVSTGIVGYRNSCR